MLDTQSYLVQHWIDHYKVLLLNRNLHNKTKRRHSPIGSYVAYGALKLKIKFY